jgi:hypothetical protein
MHFAVFGMLRVNWSFRRTDIHRSKYTWSVDDTDVPLIIRLFLEPFGSTSWPAGCSLNGLVV